MLELGKGLIDRLFPDPVKKAQAELELLQMHQQGALKETEVRLSAILEEAKSIDPWTSRARPSFLYVFYFLIVCLTVIAPFVGVFFPDQMQAFFGNVGKGFHALPEELWWTFGAGYLGYAGARTFEKSRK